jgi:hypothetical protein
MTGSGVAVDPVISLINRAYAATLAWDISNLTSTMHPKVQWHAGAGPFGPAQDHIGIAQVLGYLDWPKRVHDFGSATLTSRGLGVRVGSNIYATSHVFVTTTEGRIPVRLTIRVEGQPPLIAEVWQTFL